jgi:hypothetical protein
VTQSSLPVTGTLTLTHDVTLRARSFSPVCAASAETVAVFDSSIPEVPAESYVSPAYLEILHATLDGSTAAVSLSGESGTTHGTALGGHRFVLRHPLLEDGPTPVTLHRTGIPDLATSILWREIDLAECEYPITIRLGDSLLLTAGIGQAGALHMEVLDADGQVCRTCDGQAGEKFPHQFTTPDTYTVKAWLRGKEVGSLTVKVLAVDLHGPIAAVLDCERELDVYVQPAGEADRIVFLAADSAELTVGTQTVAAGGATLPLKPLVDVPR